MPDVEPKVTQRPGVPRRRFVYGLFNLLAFLLLASLGWRFITGQTNDFSATGPALVVLVAAAISAFIGNIERFAEFRASASGIEAKMREVEQVAEEARVTIEEFHTLAELTAVLLVKQITSGGRYGGQSSREKDEQRSQILTTLTKIGVPDQAIKRVDLADAAWTRADYAHAVMRSIEHSELCGPRLKETMSKCLSGGTTRGIAPLPQSMRRYCAMLIARTRMYWSGSKITASSTRRLTTDGRKSGVTATIGTDSATAGRVDAARTSQGQPGPRTSALTLPQ